VVIVGEARTPLCDLTGCRPLAGAQRPKAVELATCRQPWIWATLGWGSWPVVAVLWQPEHRAVTG
jgi:hypothetical protein